MAEKSIVLEYIEPLEFYGVHDQKLNRIRPYFPALQFTARGFSLHLKGPQQDIERFESAFTMAMNHYMQTGLLTTEIIDHLFKSKTTPDTIYNASDESLILFGPGGAAIRARTENQQKLIQAVQQHALVFAVGPAGTGKTYTAVALAVQALKRKSVKRIVLTRPAVEAGENLGFLPGDLKEKLDPYMQPLYDALADMFPPEKLKFYLENRTIQIAPLAFMRGRTLDHAFVILDEAQNTTEPQMKMFLTRMGQNAQFVVTGDLTQVDLPNKQKSGLLQAIRLLQDVPDAKIITLDGRDVVRHPLLKKIIDRYEAG